MSLLLEASPTGQLRAYRAAVERLLAAHDAVTEEEVDRCLGLLDAVRRRLVDELVAGSAHGWQAAYLGRLRREVDLAAARLVASYGPLLAGAARSSWEAGGAFADAALRSAGVVLGTGPGVDPHLLRVLTNVGADLVAGVSNDFRVRARRILAFGVLGGRPPTDTIRDVADLLRTESDRRGARGTVTSQAETIVRTEMLGAFGLANQLRQAEVGRSVPDLRKYWLSARDARVRPHHLAADRLYRPGGEVGPIPQAARFELAGVACMGPHDPALPAAERVNCRCVGVLWHPDWFAR